MRRKDREITDLNEIIKVMEACDVCRLALNNGEYPYILPLNFGMRMENDTIVLYFHGATEGTKYDLIDRDNHACFEMDCSHKLVMNEEKGSCTMYYESVIGTGTIRMVPEEEKPDALCVLMQHYHQETFAFNQAVLPQTRVFKLVVSQVTGKVRGQKND